MLCLNRIDIGKGIDQTKSNRSKECMICHYCFFNNGFKFQYFLCNGCNDLTILCLNIKDITNISVKILILLLKLFFVIYFENEAEIRIFS